MIRIAVIDDQELVRAGLRSVLAADPELEVVAEGANGREAIELVRRRNDLDILLLDIRMPVLDGVAALPEILALRPGLPVVMLTTFEDDAYVQTSLEAGASGFLLKRASGAELITAVRAGAAGDAVLAPEVTRAVIRRSTAPSPAPAQSPAPPSPPVKDRVSALLATLTVRELEVLRMITTGANNGEIAAALHLSENTVKSHVSHILQKLECRDRVQAALIGTRLNLN